MSVIFSPAPPARSQLPRSDWDTTSGYSHAVQTMVMMVLKQASGRPWGDHGLFLRYHIEAASVKGVNSFRQHKTDATTIGRWFLESILFICCWICIVYF